MPKLRILLLSAYDAASHRHWHTRLVDGLPQFDWTVVTLPDRHFYWRARGNGMTYAFSHRQQLCEPYDLVVATSMVDLCSLRGFLPSLASVPSIVYFHENQFAYPIKQASSNIINAQVTSIYSALCADRIVFNSRFNQETFYRGAAALLGKMPDGVEKNILDEPRANSVVLPVPIIIDPAMTHEHGAGKVPKNEVLDIVWNHRWEYDKQPEVFFAAIGKLKRAGIGFRLHIMGQSFRDVPECFEIAKKHFKSEIVTWGHQPIEEYHRILREADIVVSTAIHDFQGLSLLEAIHRGCVPVAPNRVVYPEYIPQALLYEPDSDEASALYEKLLEVRKTGEFSIPGVSDYFDGQLLPEYRQLLESTAWQ